MNVKFQFDPLPTLFDNAHARPFLPYTLSTPTIAHDQTPQPTPISPTHSQPSPKASYELAMGINLPFKG